MSGHKGKQIFSGRQRHADISRDLRSAIAGGLLPVGAVLPTELELCARYKVSRHTVRIAIADLVEAGLVNRRKRLGTVVQATTPTRSYRQTVASVDDLAQYGADHVRTVRSAALVKADPTLARDLDCPVGTRWYCVSSLRYDRAESDGPLGLTDVYVDPVHSVVGDLARRWPDRLISSFVTERTHQTIAKIKQDITAVVTDQKLSSLLLVTAGSPALRIVRHYLDDAGALVVGSVSVHPASRFHISSSLERVGPA